MQKNINGIMENLKKSLNSNGWDGRWFKRAFTDDGEPIGSIENEECRIDSISQSWGVISGAADNDKKYISMESLENHLIDKENGIIKLLDPPFNKTKIEPGYIKAYLPGVRENGGQYTHAAMWAIIAFTKLGFGDKALEYYRMINPIEHARTKETSLKYKVEPYVIPADIYGAGNLAGRGGWTWYTGSSSWFYKAGIENILGLNIKNKTLKINPCIPKEWKEYSIKYRYQNSIYNIKVKNYNGKNTGVENFYLNGRKVEAKEIILNIVTDIEVGKQYKGKVVRIMSFGAFVDLGGGKEGMIHISKLSDRRIEKVEDVLNLGDDVLVECIKVDDKNRVDFKLVSKC